MGPGTRAASDTRQRTGQEPTRKVLVGTCPETQNQKRQEGSSDRAALNSFDEEERTPEKQNRPLARKELL